MASGVAASRRWNGIWAASGGLSAVLFVAGLMFANIPPGFPAPDASLERINAYFSDHRAAALGLSVCHSLSALALLAFAAYLFGVLGRAERNEQRRSEEHTSELQSRPHLVCRLLLEKKK